MTRLLRYTVTVASLLAVLSSANLARASHIRSIVDRRQHPGHGCFVHNHNRTCRQHGVCYRR